MGVSRREFLKIAAAAGIAASLASTLRLPGARRLPGVATAEEAVGPVELRVAKQACLICGQRCPFEIHVARVGGAEVITRVVPVIDPEYPEYFAACGRPQAVQELRVLEERIPGPLLRVGRRGEGRFKLISWSEALDLLARWVREYLDEPWRIVVLSHQGAEGGLVRKFFEEYIGTENVTEHCDTCHTGMDEGHRFIIGKFAGPSKFQPDYRNAKLVVEMGRNPVGGIVASAWTKMFVEGRESKAKLIVFDVRRSRLTDLADEYFIIPPGFDLAVSLAILNVILTEGLYNREYLARWTNAPMLFYYNGDLASVQPVKLADNPKVPGKKTYLVYDEADGRFKLKVEARSPAVEYTGEYNGRRVATALVILRDAVKEYTPEWAEGLQKRLFGRVFVKASDIRRVARELAEAAPRAFIDHGYKGTRYYNEGMLKRVNLLINVLLGSVGAKGGLAYAAGKPKIPSTWSILGFKSIARGSGGVSIPEYWEKNGVANVRPHCWSMLVVRTIIEGRPYPIGLLFIHRQNLLSHAIGGRRLAEALRDENRVKHIVVLDSTFNETVMYADLVLPVTMFFEEEAPTLQYAKKSYVDFIVDAQKAVDPPDWVDARDAWWIIVELAKRLGVAPPGLKVDPIEVKKKQAEKLGIDYGELRRRGYILWKKSPRYHPWGGKPLPTVTGELEIINVKLLEEYRGYIGRESPLNPFPVWIPPLWIREKCNGGNGPCSLADNEFVLVEYQESVTATNMFIRFAKSVRDILDWKQVYGVRIHPERARKLGLKTGDMVRLVGPGGEIRAKVIVTEDVNPYVAAAPHATAVDTRVVPLEAVVEGGGGARRVRLFAAGGGYGVNANMLADPLRHVVPEEGFRAAQNDLVVRIERL